MNNFSCSGRFGKSPELKKSTKGNSWALFSIAVQFGMNREKFWLFCKAFGKTAEIICQHFGKGDGIQLVGELTEEAWTDRNTNQTENKMILNVSRFTFPEGKAGGGSPSQPSRQNEGGNDGLSVDDIPF